MQQMELLTNDTIDPVYNRPVIDQEIDVTESIVYRKVSGHFEGTDKRFNLYLPPKEQWKGRFFQMVYPLIDENADMDTIKFGLDSGAYTVQTNGGSGFRVDAAAAKFSREIAQRYYGTQEKIYGYIYGGSGGSFQTIGAIENTSGVWDGAVPFIPGGPTAIPNNFLCRAFARLVLKDKVQQIADAVSPGGSGNPYADLSEVEREVLLEVTRLGVPLRAWEDIEYLLKLTDPKNLYGFLEAIKGMDPTYMEEFWSQAGYLGTENSELGEIFRVAKTDHYAEVVSIARNESNEPISLLLDHVPVDHYLTGFEYSVYAEDGVTKVGSLEGELDSSNNTFKIKQGADTSVLEALDAKAKLRIDNLWILAVLPYHRYQIPSLPGFYAWDQYKAADGTPIYPQRPINIGSQISLGVTGGGTFTGHIKGKVIMVANLLDCDAFPWHADWYRSRVQAALGDGYENYFQIWFNDYADHVEPHNPYLINYTGILQQAVRDVSAWAEQGRAPVQATVYEVSDSQIFVAKEADSRKGVQPVIDLIANTATKAAVSVGELVEFKASIKVPTGIGKVVGIEWDFLGTGEFVEAPLDSVAEELEVSAVYTYPESGTYFAAIRVTSQRDGDMKTEFARVHNLGRVRVIVSL